MQTSLTFTQALTPGVAERMIGRGVNHGPTELAELGLMVVFVRTGVHLGVVGVVAASYLWSRSKSPMGYTFAATLGAGFVVMNAVSTATLHSFAGIGQQQLRRLAHKADNRPKAKSLI